MCKAIKFIWLTYINLGIYPFNNRFRKPGTQQAGERERVSKRLGRGEEFKEGDEEGRLLNGRFDGLEN
jgi:hypothetical protein